MISALVGGEWSASLPGRFTPGERGPGTHWIGGWVCPRAGLNDVEKILDVTGTRPLTPSVVKPVASCCTDYAVPASLVLGFLSKNGGAVEQTNPNAQLSCPCT
jgi:hypothetical protein